MNANELSERLWNFSARVGKVVNALPDNRLGRHVASQLVRSGTASGPNYDEGRVAESRADFIHKLKIALKELVETNGWLKFIVTAQLLSPSKIAPLQDECEQLRKKLTSAILTAKRNAPAKTVRSIEPASQLPPIKDRQSSMVNRQSQPSNHQRGI